MKTTRDHKEKRKGKMPVPWAFLMMAVMVGYTGIQTVHAVGPPAATPVVKSALKPAAAPAAPPVVAPPEQEYRYQPEGKIDPFKPLVNLEAVAKKRAEQAKTLPLNPLQRLGVEQFKLVGIIEGNRGRRAMVQDPSGKFYSLVPGTYVGLNKGRVSAILRDSVIVNEKVVTDEGKIQSRKQIMKLRQDEVKP
jgi:Tfp pilus assembly protein PilP